MAETAILMIFEPITDDGQPLIQSLAEEIELELPIAGRKTRITFKVKDFGVKSIDEL